MEPFVMVLRCRPKSTQGDPGKRSAYKRFVRQAAEAEHGGRGFLTGDLCARVIWLSRSAAVGQHGDVDNIVKPILDALKQVVYDDDRCVVRLCSVKHDTSRALDIAASVGDAHPGMERLDAFLTQEPADILYVEVGPTTASNVVVGPVDGVSE